MKIAEDLTQILEERHTMEQQHMGKNLPPKSKARYEVKLTNTGQKSQPCTFTYVLRSEGQMFQRLS